jgi:hypothetical protein
VLAKLKVIQVANSLGTTFSKELAARLKVDKDNTLFVTEAPGGYLLLMNPEFEAQMILGGRIHNSLSTGHGIWFGAKNGDDGRDIDNHFGRPRSS